MGIVENYTLEAGIYVPANHVEFSYSDGDEAENYLFDTIKNATDISTGSEELYCAIKDWPSNYHLSPKRADLLRPFTEELRGKRVLEIGCGCGAVTRYLGELGCTVVALEGSNRRARITKERCRDLDNVLVINDSFSNFSWHEKFDVVTLVGVLEYSNFYIDAANPFLRLLEQSRSFLTTEGCLILAIENKLGLKYWAGAPEDHTGVRYFGIENKYNRDTAVTFGKQELQALLDTAGFTDTAFFYPFPDYKIPDVIITENGLDQKKINIENVLVERFDYMQGIFFMNTFSTTLAAKSLHDNGLLSDFANSFLVRCHVNKPVQKVEENPLAFIYSTVRKKQYCKETTITNNPEYGVAVTRSYIYNETDRNTSIVQNRISDETYATGHLLFNELIPIISSAGWKLAAIKEWAAKYYTILKAHAHENGAELWLDGQYLDLSPFNVLVQDGDNYTAFDQEWVYFEPVPLYYVLFRGLVYSLGRVRYYEVPGEAIPSNIIEIAAAVIQQFLPFNETHLTDCKQREQKFFSLVSLGSTDPFSHTAIFVRENFELENQRLRGDIMHLNNNIESIALTLREAQEKNEALTAENQVLNTQLRERIQSMTAQWDEINTRVKDLLHVNHVLHVELKQKEADINRMLTEIKSSVSHLIVSYELNKSLIADKAKLQQEVEWYKRTYADRSLLGLLKEKLKKR